MPRRHAGVPLSREGLPQGPAADEDGAALAAAERREGAGLSIAGDFDVCRWTQQVVRAKIRSLIASNIVYARQRAIHTAEFV